MYHWFFKKKNDLFRNAKPKKILYIWFAHLAFIIIDMNLQDIYILHFCIRN